MSLPGKNKFDPSLALTDANGKPTQAFRDYMTKVDALLAAIIAGNGPKLVTAANDAAAAKAGVMVGQFYLTAGAVKQRQV